MFVLIVLIIGITSEVSPPASFDRHPWHFLLTSRSRSGGAQGTIIL